MAILTIDDLKKASKVEIEEAKAQIGVLDDYYKYLNWVGENAMPTSGEFTVGPSDRSLGIHPSTVSHVGFCPLRAYYECTGELEASSGQIDPKTRMIFDLGTLIHVMLQTHFHNMYGDQFEDEVPLVDEELHIKSHSDGRFTWTFARAMLEIKSIREGGSHGFEKVQKAPLPDHPRQLMCYMRLADVPFGIILYFCKNNSELKEHVVTYDEEVWQNIKQEITPVVDAAYNKGPMVNAASGGNCFLCPYTYHCEFSSRRKSRGRESDARRIRQFRL